MPQRPAPAIPVAPVSCFHRKRWRMDQKSARPLAPGRFRRTSSPQHFNSFRTPALSPATTARRPSLSPPWLRGAWLSDLPVDQRCPICPGQGDVSKIPLGKPMILVVSDDVKQIKYRSDGSHATGCQRIHRLQSPAAARTCAECSGQRAMCAMQSRVCQEGRKRLPAIDGPDESQSLHSRIGPWSRCAGGGPALMFIVAFFGPVHSFSRRHVPWRRLLVQAHARARDAG